MKKLIIAGIVGLAFAAPASAQVAWESPLLTPPRNDLGVGIYLMETTGGVGVMGNWRSAQAPAGLGFRVGIADTPGSIAAFGGVDVQGILTRGGDEFPLAVDWVLGAGASVGENLSLSFPAALTVGHSFQGEGVRFAPFATPRVVLDAHFGRDETLDLDFAADIGLDVQFAPTWLVRFGASLGRDAIAIGVIF